MAHLTEDAIGTAEIVLAEALNNVAEHAYGASGAGDIDVTVALDGPLLEIMITDAGAPLPGLHLPDGYPPALTCAESDLPEGGFGWFLIRRLAGDLAYRRDAGKNRLTLQLAIATTEKCKPVEQR